MLKVNRTKFFNRVRGSLFGGSLSLGQVENMEYILDAIEAAWITNPYWAGYILATPYWEVGRKMAPVREGFAVSDQGARTAVTRLFNSGKIKTNYGLPDKRTGKSYYGRGYVQLTHYLNYLKTGTAIGEDLVNNPDLMLDPKISARAMVWGMRTGAYRKGHTLLAELGNGKPTQSQLFNAREIINGDKNKLSGKSKVKIGTLVANAAAHFTEAIEFEMEEIKPVPTLPIPSLPEFQPEDTMIIDIEPKVAQAAPRTFWQKTINLIWNGEWK